MDVKLENQICKMSPSEFKLKTNIVELIKDDIGKNKPNRYEKELKNIDAYVNQVLSKYKESKKYRAFYNKKLTLVLATNTNILNKPMPASVREKLKRKLQIRSENISSENNANPDILLGKPKDEHNKNAYTQTQSINSTNIRKKLKLNKIESSCKPSTQPLELDCTNHNRLQQMETVSKSNILVKLDSNMSKNTASFSTLSVTDNRKLTLENYKFIRKFKTLCCSIPLDKTSSLRLAIEQILHTISYKEFVNMVVFPKTFANCGGKLLNKLKEYYKSEFYLKRTWPKELRVKLVKLKKYIQSKLYLKTFDVQDIPPKFFTFEDLGKYTNFLEILAKLDTEFSFNPDKNEDVKIACYEWFVENDKLLQNLVFNEDFFEEKNTVNDLKKIENNSNVSSLFGDINLQNLNGPQFELSRISLNDLLEHSNFREIVKNSIENVFQADVLSSDIIEKYSRILYTKICSENCFPRDLTLNAKFIFSILPETKIKYVNVTTPSSYNDVDKSKSSSDSELFEAAESDSLNFLLGSILLSTQEANSWSLLNDADVNCTEIEKDNSAKDISQLDIHTNLCNTSDASQSNCSVSREIEQLIIKEEPNYSQYASEVIFVPNSPNQEIVIDDDESKVADLLKEMFEFGASQSDCFNFLDDKS